MKQIDDIYHQVHELLKDGAPPSAPGSPVELERRQMKMHGMIVIQLCRIADAMGEK
ncbi:hypothetical protein [Asticcacaulis sp. AC402]|uniref:hypothetical protein n=1 Tax=Asticcacaulis sp. AC402 TaxID=1282361 RepID=UPI0003C3CB2A|nr:hypothetical protein [Asticcacaulis sp. AC402]ESQ76646.1 hypothetical protein ABAC402_02930 [Asticcacaulis sp. AC402]